jgi:glycosyltransferase involved in cell wall biosynthesis
MRLLYSFPHAVGRAGIGEIAYHQVRGAIRRGLDVTLFCTSLEQELEGPCKVIRTLAFGGMRVPHRALGVRRSYRYHDRTVAATLRRRGGGFDIVHSWPQASLETFGAARELGITGVQEVPNTHTGYAFEVVARELAALHLAPLRGHSHSADPEILSREEAEYRLADLLLVPSEFSRRTFLERGVPLEKLEVHRYGCDPDRFHPGPRTGRPPEGGGLTALFIGRCEPRKGLHYALRAWMESGAAERGRMLVCGDFYPGYGAALARWLDHPSVEVRGFVTSPEEVMRESDVLVLPSVEEGSALVTYEAQACGCVLAVSDAAGARCEHMRHGLIHPAGDVETLTDHLRRLTRDPGLLSSLRDETRAGRDRLIWDSAAEQLVSIYEAVVSSRVAERPPPLARSRVRARHSRVPSTGNSSGD